MMQSLAERLAVAHEPFFQGPEAVRRARAQAWDNVRKHGLPTRRVEDWKYTPLAVLDREPYAPISNPRKSNDPLPEIGSVDGCCAVFVDGVFTPGLSRLDDITPGVSIRGLGNAGRRSADALLCRAFEGTYSRPEDSLAALNTAGAGGGVLIELADSVRQDKPLRLLYLGEDREQFSALHLRNLVRLGRDSYLNLVEEFRPSSARGRFCNVVTRVILEAEASLDHVRISLAGASDVLVNRLEVSQGSDSCFRQMALDNGAGLARHDIHVNLHEQDAQCRLQGLYLQSRKSHVDNHIRVVHQVGPTRSQVVYRGVLGQHAHGVFNAKAVVETGADGSRAEQSNKNILLSRHAAVDTKPELEIYAEDVMCTHGATVGQLDDAALFYLRSRGITLQRSRSMLLEAFCKEMLNQDRKPPLNEELSARVGAALLSLDHLETP